MIFLSVTIFTVVNTFANAAPTTPSSSGKQQKQNHWDLSAPSTSFSSSSSRSGYDSYQRLSDGLEIMKRAAAETEAERKRRSESFNSSAKLSTRQYKCGEEGCATCVSLFSLEVHKSRCQKEKSEYRKYKCDKPSCSVVCNSQSSLDDHNKRMHGDKKNPK